MLCLERSSPLKWMRTGGIPMTQESSIRVCHTLSEDKVCLSMKIVGNHVQQECLSEDRPLELHKVVVVDGFRMSDVSGTLW